MKRECWGARVVLRGVVLGLLWSACSRAPAPEPSADAGASRRALLSPTSGLPVPLRAADQPRPAGAEPNLTVLPWAAFRAAASYTFDDGQPSHIEHWPELKASGAHLTFYVTTGHREREQGFDVTWRDVVASGSEVGNHTVDHCYFHGKSCGVEGKRMLWPRSRELDDASAYLKATTGQREVWTAATPYGDAAWTVETASRFLLTRGTLSGIAGDGMVAPKDASDPQNLPCLIAQEGASAAVLTRQLELARSRGKWAILTFHSLAPTRSAWFAPVDIRSVTDSIAYAQRLGDVWLDSVVQVGAYWLAEKIVSEATPERHGSEQRWSWRVPAYFPPGRYLRVRVGGGTLRQNARELTWDAHGYYEVAFDAGSLTWSP
ncbi:MAG: hypothetical protein JWN48_4342 [Myxococcaceae bacterium]|nr:hypothetical protein [Myxococcaceae bacterium]